MVLAPCGTGPVLIVVTCLPGLVAVLWFRIYQHIWSIAT